MSNASLVKELRLKTGAGMMDCKKALEETKGDIDQAIDWLRKKGLSSAAKKTNRVAADGLVSIASSATKAVAVEVNTETDFVARNPVFQDFAAQIADLALSNFAASLEDLKPLVMKNGSSIEDNRVNLVATLGEHIQIRRLGKIEVNQGAVSTYMHNALVQGKMGKIGVLVGLASAAPLDALQALGKKLCLHIAAAAPLFLGIDDVDASVLERERQVQKDLAAASGKPADIVEKMVIGRLSRYYQEICLLEQPYVMDDKLSISALLKQFEQESRSPVSIVEFLRFSLGEGIDREEKDFAAEVAAQLQR